MGDYVAARGQSRGPAPGIKPLDPYTRWFISNKEAQVKFPVIFERRKRYFNRLLYVATRLGI